MNKFFSKAMEFLLRHMEEIRISCAVICVIAFIAVVGWLFLSVTSPKTTETIQAKQERQQFLFGAVKGPTILDTVQ